MGSKGDFRVAALAHLNYGGVKHEFSPNLR